MPSASADSPVPYCPRCVRSATFRAVINHTPINSPAGRRHPVLRTRAPLDGASRAAEKNWSGRPTSAVPVWFLHRPKNALTCRGRAAPNWPNRSPAPAAPLSIITAHVPEARRAPLCSGTRPPAGWFALAPTGGRPSAASGARAPPRLRLQAAISDAAAAGAALSCCRRLAGAGGVTCDAGCSLARTVCPRRQPGQSGLDE